MDCAVRGWKWFLWNAADKEDDTEGISAGADSHMGILPAGYRAIGALEGIFLDGHHITVCLDFISAWIWSVSEKVSGGDPQKQDHRRESGDFDHCDFGYCFFAGGSFVAASG